ncbi:MAG: phasin family protein [Rickettsiales bacterium]|nr:phasin family protein [Rickettsiales bacterium]
MVGETKINYAASKMHPSATAPQPMEIRIASPAEEEPVTEIAKEPTTEKKTAAKPTSTRGRGRPAGSKNKAMKTKASTATKKKATAKKSTPKKPAANKTSSAKPNKVFATSEPFTQGNEALKAAMESNSATAEMTKTMTEEMVQFANKNFSENMALSKEFFSCRTMSDMLEIQNTIMKNNLDGFFKQSSKMSEMMLKVASESSAPINGSFTNMADEFKKKFSG